jgi:hypothetical protein
VFGGLKALSAISPSHHGGSFCDEQINDLQTAGGINEVWISEVPGVLHFIVDILYVCGLYQLRKIYLTRHVHVPLTLKFNLNCGLCVCGEGIRRSIYLFAPYIKVQSKSH